MTNSRRVYIAGRVPAKVRRQLLPRKTQIVPFELLAAVAALLCVCPDECEDSQVLHFIDCQPALRILVKGFSKQSDMTHIAGRIWFEAGALMCHYTAEYVKSILNLADAPSRQNFEPLHALGFQRLPFVFPTFSGGLDGWMLDPTEAHRLTV